MTGVAGVAGLRCAEIVELASDYIDETLPGLMWRRFVDHLPTCRGCSRYVEQMWQMLRTLRRLPSPDPVLPPSVRAALLGAVRAAVPFEVAVDLPPFPVRAEQASDPE